MFRTLVQNTKKGTTLEWKKKMHTQEATRGPAGGGGSSGQGRLATGCWASEGSGAGLLGPAKGGGPGRSPAPVA